MTENKSFYEPPVTEVLSITGGMTLLAISDPSFTGFGPEENQTNG